MHTHSYLVGYEPFNMNFMTLIFFLLPITFGLSQECPIVSLGSFICFISGMLYHGTYTHLYYIIDRIVVFINVTYFIIFGFTYTIYYLGACLCLVTLIIGYKKLSFGENGVLFHSCLHFISNVGICLLIQGCKEDRCVLYKRDIFEYR